MQDRKPDDALWLLFHPRQKVNGLTKKKKQMKFNEKPCKYKQQMKLLIGS